MREQIEEIIKRRIQIAEKTEVTCAYKGLGKLSQIDVQQNGIIEVSNILNEMLRDMENILTGPFINNLSNPIAINETKRLRTKYLNK